MTVLSSENVLPHPRANLWRIASQFEFAVKWVDGVEKAEHISGPKASVGGVWRVHHRWDSYQIIDLEITEWLEGERFGLRPVGARSKGPDFPSKDKKQAGAIELHEIILDLTALTNNQTRISLQCVYNPRNQLAKLKNLAYLRQQYLRRLEASVEALARVAVERAL
jgi:hypothetical protein